MGLGALYARMNTMSIRSGRSAAMRAARAHAGRGHERDPPPTSVVPSVVPRYPRSRTGSRYEEASARVVGRGGADHLRTPTTSCGLTRAGHNRDMAWSRSARALATRPSSQKFRKFRKFSKFGTLPQKRLVPLLKFSCRTRANLVPGRRAHRGVDGQGLNRSRNRCRRSD